MVSFKYILYKQQYNEITKRIKELENEPTSINKCEPLYDVAEKLRNEIIKMERGI